jgi:hypothetical protein
MVILWSSHGSYSHIVCSYWEGAGDIMMIDDGERTRGALTDANTSAGNNNNEKMEGKECVR